MQLKDKNEIICFSPTQQMTETLLLLSFNSITERDVLYKKKKLMHIEFINVLISVFHRAFFNSIIDKNQHMHFFTFKTVLV